MTYYGDYTTRAIVKSQYLDVTQTTDDALITDIVKDVSRQIDAVSNRRFAPFIQTRYFDTPLGYDLYFDTDLFSVTSITNGQGAALTASDYKLYPLNESPKQKATIIKSTGLEWQMNGTSDPEGAISVAGAWCYARDGGWIDSGAVLGVGANDTTTSLTVTTGKINVGQLVKIDDEYLYVTAVTVSTSDTLTVVRGVNGSTAASHLISAALYYWQPDQNINLLAQQASAAAYRLRANPVGDTVTIDGVTFATPKDVTAFIYKRLTGLGLKRQVIG